MAVIGALIVYTLVGTNRQRGVGPEPGTAILDATGVGAIAAGDPERYIALIAALALVVSGICLAAAVAFDRRCDLFVGRVGDPVESA
jgi:SulP family sulfate permease